MTHETEAKLLEIGKRYFAVAIQVSNAYANEQAQLNLERVLSKERLSSKEGTSESLSVIHRISELTKTHKEVFQKIILASAADNSSALAELPELEQKERLSKLSTTIHRHLLSQAAFYEAREQWIDAAAKICNLIQASRETAIFTEVVQFATAAEHEEFELQMARIEDAHQKEVKIMNEKMDRISKAMLALGVPSHR